MKHVIVGNSYSAVFAIEAIRRVNPQDEITVVSREPYHVYARAAIHEYMSGIIGDKQIYCRDHDFYAKHRVTPVLGRTIEGIDSSTQAIFLDDGKKIGYDNLLLSPGGEPIIPEIDGAKGTGVFTFTTWDGAQKL